MELYSDDLRRLAKMLDDDFEGNLREVTLQLLSIIKDFYVKTSKNK